MKIEQQYVRTVSVYQPGQSRLKELSREVSGQAFDSPPQQVPQDAVVMVGLYTARPADSERSYGWRDTVHPDGNAVDPPAGPPTGVPPQGVLFLARSQTVQYSGNSPAVLFCETLQDGPDAYSVEVLDARSDRARYIRSDGENYGGDPAAVVAREVAKKTPDFVKQVDERLAQTRGKFLQSRYGGRKDLSVLEVGPGTTGVVPRAFLQAGNGNRYTGIDFSAEALQMQKSVLASDGVEVERMTQLVGDASRTIPVPDASQDLVVGYSSIGTWGPTEEVKATFDELARILKPGGELLADGTGLDCASPPAIAHILSKFELVPERESQQGVDYILRRRG